MAGAFTHMAIVAGAIKSFPPEQKMGNILRRHRNFLTLGSVSPDIPYLAFLALKGFAWADIMHYHQTNGIVKNAFHSLSVASKKEKDWECQLAWLMGFVAHLVADATIHPIVESIVGPYTDSSSRENHRLCEMTQDIMIFKEVLNLELAYAEYTDLLKASVTDSSYQKVCEFWESHVKVNFPIDESFSAEDVINSYYKLLSVAEGGSELARGFRHLGVDFIYPTYDELEKETPQFIKQYYSEVQLPNGMKGHFREHGYEYAVKNLTTIWSKIDRALFTTDNIIEFVPNWNLDNGMDQTTGIQTFWS